MILSSSLVTVVLFILQIWSVSCGWTETVYVKAGQSIQAAINSAGAHATIIVEDGTYAEQLTIECDGINLVGNGAILVPPKTPGQNLCSGLAGPDTQAGICIAGYNVQLADFVVEHRKVISVGRPVTGVSVSGFDVRGFSGLDIAVVGGQDTVVAGNKLEDGDMYGCLTVGSKNTHVDGNNVVSSEKLRFIGICMDDKSDVLVSNNHINGYLIGLCVQTAGANVRNNQVTNGCIGAFIDPGINGATVAQNHISTANPACADIPEIGIEGIIISGATNSIVQQNLIENLTFGGLPNQYALGIAILDDFTTTPPSIASGNKVLQNILRHNDFDIYVNTTGTGNVIQNNQCSTQADLCSS